MAIGDGRRKTLDAIEEKDRLDPVEDPETLQGLIDAVEEIALSGVLPAPEKPVKTMRNVYRHLPEEAKEHYITDETLLRRINAARRQFNEWMGRRKRVAEMPSPVEAGPSNYPAKKARKRTQSERKALEELDDKVGRIRAGAKGGRQRALQAIGSSVAEQNEKDRQSKRDQRREQLEKGDIVQFRNPDLQVGRVVRVNKKSVTVEYERSLTKDPLTGEELDPMATDRVDLDSQFLTLLDVETLEEAEQQMNEGDE